MWDEDDGENGDYGAEYEDDYAEETFGVRNGLFDSFGVYEVVRSADPVLLGGQQFEVAYDGGTNAYLARLPEREVVASVNFHEGRWQPGPGGVDIGELDTYKFTLRPIATETGPPAALIEALDEARAPLIAELRHELGLPAGGDDRFACLNCGRAASVVVTHDRFIDLLGSCQCSWTSWTRLVTEMDGGTPRIVPGWLELNDTYHAGGTDFGEATGVLEAMVETGILRREGNGYLPAEPRCSNCMPAPPGPMEGAD